MSTTSNPFGRQKHRKNDGPTSATKRKLPAARVQSRPADHLDRPQVQQEDPPANGGGAAAAEHREREASLPAVARADQKLPSDIPQLRQGTSAPPRSTTCSNAWERPSLPRLPLRLNWWQALSELLTGLGRSSSLATSLCTTSSRPDLSLLCLR